MLIDLRVCFVLTFDDVKWNAAVRNVSWNVGCMGVAASQLKPVCLPVSTRMSLSWNMGLATENTQILCDLDKLSS